jgi:hypothetical protein
VIPTVLALAVGALPILSGHSHNDYERDAPLAEALAAGLISVEVDVHLVDGALLVGHDEDDLEPGRTLESLYLDPLLERARSRGGRIYDEESLILLVDVKSDADPAYRALRRVLADYAELLGESPAVAVVVSGNRARDLMLKDGDRIARYDGRLSDLEEELPPGFVGMISDDWEDHFDWRGRGPMSKRDRAKLARIVRTAHVHGWRFRFWQTPGPDDRRVEDVWAELLAAGVDLIGTEDPLRYRDFASRREPR